MDARSKVLNEFRAGAKRIAKKHGVSLQQAIDAVLDPPSYSGGTWQATQREDRIEDLTTNCLVSAAAATRAEDTAIERWIVNAAKVRPPGTYAVAESKEKPVGENTPKFVKVRTRIRSEKAVCGDDSNLHANHIDGLDMSRAINVTKEKEAAMKTPNRSLVSTAAGTFVAKLRKGSGLSATTAAEGAKLAAKLTGAKMAMTIAHRGVVKLVEKSPLPLVYKGPALWALNTKPGFAAVGATAGAILPFAQPFLPTKYQSVCAEASFVLSTRSQQFVYETWGDAAVQWLSSMLDEMAPALGVSVLPAEDAPRELDSPAVSGEVMPKVQRKVHAKSPR